MEYAKDENFNIHYNAKKGTIKYGTSNKRQERNFLKQSKWLPMFVLLGVTFSIINCILIVDFFKILTNI